MSFVQKKIPFTSSKSPSYWLITSWLIITSSPWEAFSPSEVYAQLCSAGSGSQINGQLSYFTMHSFDVWNRKISIPVLIRTGITGLTNTAIQNSEITFPLIQKYFKIGFPNKFYSSAGSCNMPNSTLPASDSQEKICKYPWFLNKANYSTYISWWDFKWPPCPMRQTGNKIHF